MTTEVLWKFPVFMDLRTHGPYFERMVFELFYDRVLFVAENFRALCTANNMISIGEKGFSARTGKHLRYRRCFLLPVKEGDSYVKGGAICYEAGTIVYPWIDLRWHTGPLSEVCGEGRESIFLSFSNPNENDGSSTQNKLNHNREGLLSISKRDLEVSNSHFMITLKADENLDSSHVVFGKLVEGWGTLQAIRDYIRRPIEIINCGMLYNPKHIGPNVIRRPCQSDVVSAQGKKNEDSSTDEEPSFSKPKRHKVQAPKGHSLSSQNQTITK